MSKHSIPAGDGPGLLGLLTRLRTKAERVAGVPVAIVVIQEAGLDGFWVHRLPEANRIESQVVDAASIAVPRRRLRQVSPESRRAINSSGNRDQF
jgi:transposase